MAEMEEPKFRWEPSDIPSVLEGFLLMLENQGWKREEIYVEGEKGEWRGTLEKGPEHYVVTAKTLYEVRDLQVRMYIKDHPPYPLWEKKGEER